MDEGNQTNNVGHMAVADGLPSFLQNEQRFEINCNVHLPDFEGPLDLLLYLIKSHEMNILNLSVAKITAQYLDFLNYMRQINIDVASEYLVMAATLTFIKSREILPKDKEEEEAMGPDPRKALIDKLLRLKCYKDLAKMLSERPQFNRDIFGCRNTGLDDIQEGLEPEVALTNPYQLNSAYKAMIERQKKVTHRIALDDVPVIDSMKQIVERLKVDEEISFQSLLPNIYKSSHVVSSFLGVLEMTKLQLTQIRQEKTFGPIHIARKMSFEDFDKITQKFSNLEWD